MSASNKERASWALNALRRFSFSSTIDIEAALIALRAFASETKCAEENLETQIADLVADLKHLEVFVQRVGVFENMSDLKKALLLFGFCLRALAEREKLDWNEIIDGAEYHFKEEPEEESESEHR